MKMMSFVVNVEKKYRFEEEKIWLIIVGNVRKKIPLIALEANRFIERNTKNRIWLHNECYLQLTKNEMKQISYDLKRGPASGLRKNLKIEGFFIGGLFGGLGYSRGAFSGAMWATNITLVKKGMSFEELDDLCIDRYGYHYPILPNKLQNETLALIES